MPTYRVKSGVINLKDKITGKRGKATVGELVTLDVRTATIFKGHLEPLSKDARFLDEGETGEKFNREYLRIAEVKGVPSVGKLYDVVNTITGRKLNDKHLTLDEAESLAKGIGIPVTLRFDGTNIKEEDNGEDRMVAVPAEDGPVIEQDDEDGNEEMVVDENVAIDKEEEEPVIDVGEVEKPKKISRRSSKKSSSKKK